jgi:hypothetical protein
VKKVPVGDNKVWLRDMVREVKTFERSLATRGGVWCLTDWMDS